MTGWLVTLLVCAALTAAGLDWAVVLAPGAPRLPRLGMAYLAGAALVTLAMMLIALLDVPVNRASVAAAFLACALGGRIAARRAVPAPPDPPRGPIGRLNAGLAATGAIALAVGVAVAVRRGPITDPDYLHAWGLRGVYEFAEHSMTFHGHTGPNLYYPLEISNLNAAVWIVLGRVDDTVVRLPQAIFAIAFATVLWWLLRLMLPAFGAALGLTLAVCTPQFVDHMSKGLADLALASYVTVAALAAVLWVWDGGDGFAQLSGMAAGAAAWTKVEGTPTTLVLLATVMLLRGRIRSPGVGRWIAWFALFTVPWQVFMRIYGIPLNRSHLKRLYLNLPWIVEHVARDLADTSRWGLFWPMCLLVIALTAPVWWTTRHRVLALLTLPNLVFTLGAYVTQYRAGNAGSVHATAGRLYLHLAPGVAAMTAAAVCVAWPAARVLVARPSPGPAALHPTERSGAES